MHFALNSFFRPIFGLYRKRMRTRLKPNFHAIDNRYKFPMIDLILIATIDKKSRAMALLANVSTKLGTSRERTTRDEVWAFLGDRTVFTSLRSTRSLKSYFHFTIFSIAVIVCEISSRRGHFKFNVNWLFFSSVIETSCGDQHPLTRRDEQLHCKHR